MNIAVIYFSATGNTAKIAKTISEYLKSHEDVNLDEIDITTYSSRDKEIKLDKYEGIFFGFPIYALRAPRLLRDWLKTLEGKNKMASTFFTYGGVKVGIAHHNIKRILEDKNFQVVSTGEFLGKHTSNLAGWTLMSDRPNQEDLNIAKEYAEKTLIRFKGEDPGLVVFDAPELTEKQVDRTEESANKRRIPPSRHGEECSLCKTCEENCPTNAMDAESGEADPVKCIGCLKCVYNCPDKALQIADRTKMYTIMEKALNLTPEILASRKSKYFL
ncbi:MAG: EFR1 family ferrodoxin [Promethearchaeota archaeon]